MTQIEKATEAESFADMEDFVTRYRAAWAAWDPVAFADLWHPDGILHTPVANGPVPADKQTAMTELQKELVPDLTWQANRWAWNGDVVFIEWTCAATINDEKVEWSGTDIFVVRDGRIAEEVVHQDMLPMWAALDPAMAREPMIDVGSLSSVHA